MKSWVLFASMMLSQLSSAADVPGSSDLPDVERPLGSEIVRYSEGVKSAIRLPLERVERVNNRLVIDEELDIEGHVIDITYELGAREEYEPFMAALKTKMTEQGAEILFFCESRGCGISGLWANTLFKVRELYGPNGTQIYFVVKLLGAGPRYLSAYGIERGNRRQYVHIRMVEPDVDQSQFEGALELLTDGRMILPVEFAGNRVSPESRAVLREMADRIKPLDVSELAIVAYRPVTPGGTLSDAITQSNARADHVQALLEEAGLMIEHAQGLGPLVAPGGLSPDRVEIVKFR
jgi:hypothetical protein